MKKAQTKLFAIVLGAIVVLGISVGLYVYNEDQKTITGNAISNLEKQLEEQGELTSAQERQLEELAEVTCKKVQVPYEAQESYSEQEPYSDEECKTENLKYNVDDFVINYQSCLDYDEECLNYVLGFCTESNSFCVEKKISCSLTINNLDDKSGYWNFDFEFYDKNNAGTSVEVTARGSTIYPQTNQVFQASYTATGRENSGKDYSCKYSMGSLPTKTTCETITKYKAVTKYRTVTKYKTETVCE